MEGETTLLPCPFCGNEVRMRRVDFPDGDAEYVFDCACGRKIFETASKSKAVTAWNTRATLGGHPAKLTAEQVMSIARKHQPDYCLDTHVCFDWQAIADELNVSLGEECDVKWRDIEYNGEADEWTCLSCGERWMQETDLPAACPWCRKAVKR